MAFLYLRLEHVDTNISPQLQSELDALETTLESWTDILSFKDSHYFNSDTVGYDIIRKLDDTLKAEAMTSTSVYYDNSSYHKLTFEAESKADEVETLINSESGWDMLKFSCIDQSVYDDLNKGSDNMDHFLGGDIYPQ